MKKNTAVANCFELFFCFLKIGAFTFGGGYAMIPLIQQTIIEDKGWINDEELMDMLVISESTPGPIAVNAATIVGYKISGVFGSLFATIGVILPSFLIISLVFFFLAAVKGSVVLAYALRGIQAGVVILVASAAFRLFNKLEHNAFNIIIALLSFGLSAFTTIDIAIIMLGAAILGIIRYLPFENRRQR